VGLNLTRATLDAVCKYPWARGASGGKFGVYPDDREVFDWFRRGATGSRRSFEAQVMDFADDVAYSVHDVEDGIQAGHIDLPRLADSAVRGTLSRLVVDEYLPGADPAAVDDALSRLLAQPFWPTAYGGTLRDLAALKDMTSQLIGRFTTAAEAATREANGPGLLARHHGTLRVPEDVRVEVAALKGIAYMFVMRRSGSDHTYEHQRSILLELVDALTRSAPAGLDTHLQPLWEEALDDAARLRVVVDQVAGLTDLSVAAWHREHCR
jgi:dGTPase